MDEVKKVNNPPKKEIHRVGPMDLKIYSPRLWLDSWQSLETLAKIISVTSISDLQSFLDDLSTGRGVIVGKSATSLPHRDLLRLEHCCRSRIRRWRTTSTAWCSWPARRLRTAAISSRPSTSFGSSWPPHPGRTPFRWAIWSCGVRFILDPSLKPGSVKK